MQTLGEIPHFASGAVQRPTLRRTMSSATRLEDIAAKVGVSVSTASRALAGSTAISAETRKGGQGGGAGLGLRGPA